MTVSLKCAGGACVGEVAEWSKANDSKSFEGQPSVGSNPTLSVPRSSLSFAKVRGQLLGHGFWVQRAVAVCGISLWRELPVELTFPHRSKSVFERYGVLALSGTLLIPYLRDVHSL